MSHLCDIAGLRVGHASDPAARSGTTTVLFDKSAVCGVAVHGGAPGTRETDLLRPGNLNPGVDAIVLSGGSAFGLAAADGAHTALAEMGRGFAVGPHHIPIVPAAIVFDLKGPRPDYRALGAASLHAATGDPDRRQGTIGAGTGATVAGLKGGIGSASEKVGETTVAALTVTNAVGAVTAANGPWFRAAPFEREGEFGGLTAPADADFSTVRTKLEAAPGANTVIAVVATDATLTAAEATRLALVAHDGIALAAWPAHTILDGDTIFAASTARVPGPIAPAETIAFHAAAVRAMARSLALAVYHATPTPEDALPAWRTLYG